MLFDLRANWNDSIIELSDNEFKMNRTAKAWNIATNSLNAKNLALNYDKIDWSEETLKSLQILEEVQLQDDLFEWYLKSVTESFSLVQTDINSFLDKFESESYEPSSVAHLLHGMGTWQKIWHRPIEAFWPSDSPFTAYKTYRKHFLTNLYAILPPSFTKVLTSYLRYLLQSSSSPLDSMLDESTPLAIPTLVSLLERYDPLLFGLIYEEIEKKVERECKGVFDSSQLDFLGNWLSEGVMGWVSSIYAVSFMNLNGGVGSGTEKGKEEAVKMLKPTFTRFEYHVHKTLCILRSNELFDIIVDYPESKAALEDLKICLGKADQRAFLVNRLRALVELRLLHPGADTRDIITQYISTIRCLRMLDPQGVLLSRVAEPIRKYLRLRDDTIRCIVSSLIEEGNELVEELAASDAKPVHDSKDEAENFNDPKWVPDPIDAPADFRKNKSSDIIQLLVSIYDTKDVFIKELQVLLAQRLLAIKDYALDREIKNVEILKIRFGESSLQGCEVMIKDLQDSKRIDHQIHEHIESPLHATIVSQLFWPSFQHAGLKLPGQLGKAKSNYNKTFVRQKPDKKLKWLPQLGTMNITVDLKDRSMTLDVTPVQASILELFSQKDTWTTEALGDELRLTDLAALKNSLYFWNNHGVLKSLPDETWKLLEEKDESTEAAASHVIEDSGPAVQSVESLQIEQMRVYWQFVQGMLTNLGALPITRIHTTLNMLVPTYKGKTPDELKAFLEVMQSEGLVEKQGETSWKIVR